MHLPSRSHAVSLCLSHSPSFFKSIHFVAYRFHGYAKKLSPTGGSFRLDATGWGFFPFVVVESPQPKLRTQFGVLSGHRVRARSRPLRAARRWTEGSPKHAAFSRASSAFTVVPEARVLVVCCVRRVQTKVAGGQKQQQHRYRSATVTASFRKGAVAS